MKKRNVIVALFAVTLGMGISSCKKEGCTDSTATNYNAEANKDDGSCTYEETPSTTTPPTYTPNYTGTFGALIAINTVSTTSTLIGPVDTQIGTSVAVFSENSGTSYIAAGTVQTDGNSLTQNDNNSYTFIPSTSNPMGITYGSTVDWSASGGAWPAFTASTTQGFSTISEISSGDVNTSGSYTLQCPSVTNADSVLFAVYGPSGSKVVIVGGSNTSHTFTASDLSSLGSGQGFVQIVGINYDPQTISTRQYWLLNETVRTKQVTLN